MLHALQLAKFGRGMVEPNPMVGAVIVDDQRHLIAEGYHQRFGEAHAEIHAIAAAGDRCRGATLFVTLEPCSHFGKTPPCADAVIRAGFRKVVIACEDPALHVAGRGVLRLQEAGIDVQVGLCQEPAMRLIAPFRMLQREGRPWVHAKWAMTLDGRIASSTGHSKWISCAESRATVHQLRGQMDAIITGAGTVRADDPMLTARPQGPRTALRVVVDPRLSAVTPECQLVRSISDAPLLVCVSSQATQDRVKQLTDCGVEVLIFEHQTSEPASRLLISPLSLLHELARRNFCNVMLEGGSGLLGSFFDADVIDELHVFIAPKITGGSMSLSPVGGTGLPLIPQQNNLSALKYRPSGCDLCIQADVIRNI